MRTSLKGFAVVAAGLSLFGIGTSQVRADILPGENAPVITPNATGASFTYDILLTATQTLTSNDYFTIYDFNFGTLAPNATVVNGPAIVAPGSFLPVVFQLVSPPVLSSTGTALPNDNPALTNATFVYTGPTVPGNPLAPTLIATVTLNTSLTGPGVFTAFAGNGTDRVTGLQNANITNVLTPSQGPINPVPEPGVVAFAAISGLGMLGMMGRARLRSKRSA